MLICNVVVLANIGVVLTLIATGGWFGGQEKGGFYARLGGLAALWISKSCLTMPRSYTGPK
jgi:hypothetical protein